MDHRELPYHDNKNRNRLAKIRVQSERPLQNFAESERKKWDHDHAYQKTALNRR